MKRFPTAQAVSRALRRDADIVTGRGYRVRQGLKGVAGPTIIVDVADAEAINQRLAAELADLLASQGWEVRVADDAAIIRVNRISP